MNYLNDKSPECRHKPSGLHPHPSDPRLMATVAERGVIGNSLEMALTALLKDDYADSSACCRSTDDNPTLPLFNHRKRKRPPTTFSINNTTEENNNTIRSDDDSKINSEDLRNTAKSQVRFTSKIAKQILSAFGRSVATNWTSVQTTSNETPPDGLLRGKVHYYNHFGAKWRIVMKDVEIRPRVNFDPKRAKSHGETLWERSISERSVESHKVKGHLQVLAFDDVIP